MSYPTNRLLGVLDDPAASAQVVDALVGAGFAPEAIVVLAGEGGSERLGRLGGGSAALARVVRAFQFVLMDQTPDFLVYERALADGRAVIAVGAPGRERMLVAVPVLERAGGHFINWFGRYQTEEVSLWRGVEPEIPEALRR